MDIIKTLGSLDYGFLAVLGICMLLGAAKGFVHVIMSLAGWFVALIIAHYSADFLSPYLVSTGLGDTPRYVLAFVIAFVIALVAWGIVTMMIKQAVSSIGLGGLDRLLGGAVGLFRGAVILISITVLVSMTPADQSTTWQNSTAVKMAKAAAQASKPFLPAKIAAIVP
jgi:membrane protein required for colicin V production